MEHHLTLETGNYFLLGISPSVHFFLEYPMEKGSNVKGVEGVKDTLYRFQCIKCYVCVEGVEDTLYRFQCIKCYVCRRRRRWCLRLLHNTVCRVQISCQRCRRYSVYSGSSPR